MSVDQLPPGNARTAKRDTQFVRYDEYIDKQIQATRRMVKTVDVMTALLVMAAGTLGFLLVAAIVEHWLVPGGFNLGARLLLFVVLFGSLTFYTTRRLWPLFAGSINPAYAAQAIEHDNPSLKNSLLNLLLFRERRDDITDAVYETLEEQAAKRLTRVPVDSAIDRTQLLRLGYVLVAIVAASALYKILSPKDPFVSAERVLMPWARIVPASRVSIENVTPGAVTLARGEVLNVSADVRGISDDDPVVVRYTTADGQAVDRPASMKPSSAGLRFTGQIPPAENGAKAGIAQNLRYRIEAGDARSLEYLVTVVAAPTITVERIDYDYPEYTGFTDRSVERLGDIRAIEGTRITIHARANQPIEDAAVDFEADGRRDVRLEADGSDAKASFTLELRDDRQTPKFTSYVLRFTGADGRPNRDPVKFPIDVAPDHAPEVSILAPAEKTRDVRLDETVAIEVDSIDPDFALAEVRLHGEAAGQPVLDEQLLAEEHTGRYTGRLLFTPHEHDLKSGDVVRYWVTARDNRTPQANEASTDSQTLRIVGADPRQPGKPPQGRNAQRDKSEPKDNPQSKEGEQQEDQGGRSSDSSEDEQQGESASAEGQSGQTGDQDSSHQSGEGNSGQNQSGEQWDDQSNQSESGETESGNNSSGGQSSAGETGNESGEAQQQPGGGKSSGQNGKPSDSNQSQSQQPGGNESGGEQDNAKSSAGQPNSKGESGSKTLENSEPQPGASGSPQPGSESSPVSPEGDNDGEAFERIQDFLKREGKLPRESPQQESKPGESASADGQEGNQGENAQPNDDAKNPDSKSNEIGEQPSGAENQSTPTLGSKSQQPGTAARPGEPQENSADPSQQRPDENRDSHSPDGQHTSSEGESGAGQQPEESQGSPESKPESKPGDKWQQKLSGDQPGEKKGDQQEPPSGGQGKKKNDSQGDQGGDRSGGGEEGAGQKSEHEGTGSAGQNQSADEGAGQSSEQGAGNNSPDAGPSAKPDAKSNDPTGQSGSDEKGNGSSQRDGEGEQPGGTQNQNATDQGAGEQQPTPHGEPASAGGDQPQTPNSESNSPNAEHPDSKSEPANPNASDSNPQQQAPSNTSDSQDSASKGPQQPNAKQPSPLSQDSNSSSSTADGAGRVPNGTMQPSASTGEAPAADAANLEYARKQTDLVLETLAEQMKRKQVDKKLLDKLGWTEADLKRFLDRWQQLKAAARDDSPVAEDAQRELDDALRSLGLRRGQLEQAKVSDDANRNLRQGYRGAIPLEYQERLRAYNQGVSRARQSDE